MIPSTTSVIATLRWLDKQLHELDPDDTVPELDQVVAAIRTALKELKR